MNDNMFDALGSIAWYKTNVDEVLDLVKVGNEYISKCKDNTRSKLYGKSSQKQIF